VLPKRLEQEFWLELKAYEEERQMPYITSVERIGYDRGKQEGRQEGQQSLILILLERKIGQLPQALCDRIATLSPQALETLAIDLLNFGVIEDLANWLQTHSS